MSSLQAARRSPGSKGHEFPPASPAPPDWELVDPRRLPALRSTKTIVGQLLMTRLRAIAAMSRNRVIGRSNTIPWHLPADFQWFKRTTMGHILVMGRKTYLSIGRPLPGRETWVLSRGQFSVPGVRVIPDLAAALDPTDPRDVWICGGAEIYRQFLPACQDLYLTVVHQDVDGDAFFPPYEDQFNSVEKILDDPAFTIRHYMNRTPRSITPARDRERLAAPPPGHRLA